jgi:hypothetical protein
MKKILDGIVRASKAHPLCLYHCVDQKQFRVRSNKAAFAFEPRNITPEQRSYLNDHLQQYLLRIPASHPRLKRQTSGFVSYFNSSSSGDMGAAHASPSSFSSALSGAAVEVAEPSPKKKGKKKGNK